MEDGRMKLLTDPNLSIADAKRQGTREEKDAQRMERKNAGFTDGPNSLITVKQHEQLMVAALTAYDQRKNAEIFEYIEYRLSVSGRLAAYKRLWMIRAARVAKPIVQLVQQRQLRKFLATNQDKGQATMHPDQVVEAIQRG
jgi:siroheme synthase